MEQEKSERKAVNGKAHMMRDITIYKAGKSSGFGVIRISIGPRWKGLQEK